MGTPTDRLTPDEVRTLFLFESLDAGRFFSGLSAPELLAEQYLWLPVLSVSSSLAFMAFLLYASFQHFAATDY